MRTGMITVEYETGTSPEDVTVVVTGHGWATVDLEVRRGSVVLERFERVFLNEDDEVWMGKVAKVIGTGPVKIGATR